LHEQLPCWYELSLVFEGRTPAIVLRLRNDYLESLQPIPPDAPIINYVTGKYKLPFGIDFTKDIGLDNCLRRAGTADEFTNFHVPIPVVKSRGPICSNCEGKKRDRYGSCRFCDGTGYESVYDHLRVDVLSATLAVVSMIIQSADKETSSPDPQLFTFRVNHEKTMSGMGVYGDFGPEFVAWLTSIAPRYFSEVSQKMCLVDNRMMGDAGYTEREFSVVVHEDGGLHLNCPGNACGLDPSHSRVGEHGYEFGPHNVDSAVQQLTLLAGLAAIHDLARQEMEK
jgi:hypothetical protein